ncbi:MAG TPA: proline racemase family protein [Verrucomicrobiaceae bacterium]
MGGTVAGMQRIAVIDSHTAGEPTRVVIRGAPDLGSGSIAEQWEDFRRLHDRFRSAVVCEPRGSDVMVGALLLPPRDPSCVAGVIFFNNVGLLRMCGHGIIGLVKTLVHMGRVGPGTHAIETVAGVVSTTLNDDGSVSLMNVPSRRVAKEVALTLEDGSSVTGDVAWGGNWFFLAEAREPLLTRNHAASLTEYAWQIRRAANASGYPGIDHVELFGPPNDAGARARNFVLCPGGAYDRSPCGTGTSAKLACLAADGKLGEGEEWVQESIIGSRFTGSFRWQNQAEGWVLPTIRGTAFVTAESTLLLEEGDPFRGGIDA